MLCFVGSGGTTDPDERGRSGILFYALWQLRVAELQDLRWPLPWLYKRTAAERFGTNK